jgi:two-component system cell cycle response regulator
VHIVVVDPSRTILKAVSRLLERDGHVVALFVDGREALDFIKSTPDVSALITSAELTTSMSGLELCWETRLLSGYDRAIYIILMSSNAGEEHLVNALDSGADEFIHKPPSSEELYARLRSAERLLRLQRKLFDLAMTDPLTGVFNRRAFFEKARKLCPQAEATQGPTAIMFDVDHFKRVNDTHGHDVGDEVLRAIGREASCDGAIIGRLGGEEFALVLEASSLQAGVALAERLRTDLAALSFDTVLGKMRVTCSFGVAEWRPGETVDQLLKRTDTALYKAKHGGRNRVVTAQPDDFGAGDAPWSRQVRSDSRSKPGASEQSPLPPSVDLLTTWSSNMEENMTSSPSDNSVQPNATSAFVLDDEPKIAALICKVLRMCGLTSQQFNIVAPFLAAVEASPPGLVVLDLSLGQSDAVEVILSLEARKYRGKVLLISGRDEITLNEITQIGEKHGLVMLPPLKKPFRPADVKRRLASHAADAVQSSASPVKPKNDTRGKPVIQVVEALRNHWLDLWYQPKFDLKTGQVCGAEGLIRAQHPLHGVIMPENLLPPAGSPDYLPLTEFVVKCAMTDWVQFARQGLPLKLSINAPVSVIHTPAFVELVRSARPKDLEFTGLMVEVTEDEVIRDSERAREVASQLKLYNVDLSIDDFGSGYASLSRLNDLQFAEVKIDRSFVTGCTANELKRSLCQTAIDLAHRFDATACAEGVETAEDLRTVMAMGCDTAQGFLLGKPLPAAEFTEAALVGGTRAVRAILQASAGKDQSLAQTA